MARTNIADVSSMIVLDDNGDPVSGGKYRIYQAGTTTDVTLHDAVSGGSAVANPIIADSAGRVSEAFCDAQKIKIVVLDANDVELAVYDHLDATGEDDESGFVDLTSTQTITGAKTMDIIGNATGLDDTNNNEIIVSTATASAVNHIGVTNAATGGAPAIAATGDDANIDLKIEGKGTGLPDLSDGFKSSSVTAFAIGTQQVLTSGTTYTPPTGCRAIEVTCVGGGGGGGGTGASGASTAGVGGAGSGGGMARMLITSLESSYTYAIGAAGTGGAAGTNNGANGGNTTFAGGSVSISANGGVGGGGGTATSGTSLSVGAAGGAATGGDLNLPGNSAGSAAIVSGDAISIPSSGASPLGGGAVQPSSTNADGTDATAKGAGGGGGISFDSATTRAGGDGAPGVIIVSEYY